MKKVKLVSEKAVKATAKKATANIADQLIIKGGTWEELTTKLRDVARDRNQNMKWSVGQIKAHIKYRDTKTPNWKLGNKIQITKDGIKVTSTKSKKVKVTDTAEIVKD